MKFDRPTYLRGYTSGNHVHAINVLASDPNPRGHGHGPRNALCGAFCSVKPVGWSPQTPHACKRCIAISK
jgi:hypothetical protein